ncbi:MAG: hypothetical protein HY960_15515 [Ignavibacteriae bacterium]|nr:hypothetical protein [Ignavibacteriota bacterium]
MEILSKAIETTAQFTTKRNLILDKPLLNVKDGSKVRVIILLPDEDDIDELLWLKAASSNEAFAFLKEPDEDIYTVKDGKPFNDKE